MKTKLLCKKAVLRGTLALLLVAILFGMASFFGAPVGCRTEDLMLQKVMVAAAGDTPAPAEKVVYLTFDDGPSDVTPKILDILKDEGVPGSFFVICAPNNEKHFPLVQRMKDEGHCVALHTCTHEYDEIYASPEAFWQDIERLQDALTPYGLAGSTVLRFPGGSSNTVSHKYGGSGIMKILKQQAIEKGFNYVDWNVCADDSIGGKPSASTIYNNIIHDVGEKSNCIVLMHDSKQNGNTAEALRDVIAWFRNAGYRFDVVDNLPKREATE